MSTMVGWTFRARVACDFAGISIPAGATLHVYPGTSEPVVLVQDLPPNYGVIAGLLCDELIEQIDGPSIEMLPLPAPLPVRLVPTARRGASRSSPRRSARLRSRLALVR
jgi:hypothetical protein